MFPGKFHKKSLPTWLDLTEFFHARVHMSACVFSSDCICSHMTFLHTDNGHNNTNNVVKTIACCPGVFLCVKTLYLPPWGYIFGHFKRQHDSFRLHFYISVHKLQENKILSYSSVTLLIFFMMLLHSELSIEHIVARFTPTDGAQSSFSHTLRPSFEPYIATQGFSSSPQHASLPLHNSSVYVGCSE